MMLQWADYGDTAVKRPHPLRGRFEDSYMLISSVWKNTSKQGILHAIEADANKPHRRPLLHGTASEVGPHVSGQGA